MKAAQNRFRYIHTGSGLSYNSPPPHHPLHAWATPQVLLLMLFTLLTTGCSSFLQLTNDPNKAAADELGYRTLGTVIEDESIEGRLLNKFTQLSPALSEANVKVTSFNGVVLITGTVKSKALRDQAEEIAKATIPQIRMIHNELAINNTYNSAAVDQWISARIKARMLFTEQFPASKIKVTTHNRVVYLFGMLTQSESNWAVNIAKQTKGVRKIVKIIEPLDATVPKTATGQEQR